MKQLPDSKAVIVLLALAVIASGCADSSGEEASKTAPVQVVDFSATPDPAPADRIVRLQTEVQNTGDTDASNVVARIGGPTFATESGQSLTWRSDDGGPMASRSRRSKRVGNGELPAPAEDQPALPRTTTFTLKAPAYGQGRESTDRFRLEVFYEYNTSASTELTIMTDERYRENGATKTPLSFDNSAGPVQLDIRGSSPKVHYGDSQSQQICVVVRNSGVGTAFLREEGNYGEDDGYYNVNSENRDQVEVTLSDVGNVNFEPLESDSEGDEHETITSTVQLINGEEGSQCYSWEVDNLQQEEQTIPLQVTASYGYVKETSTSVTVEGRRGVDTDSTGDSGDETEYSWEGSKSTGWNTAQEELGGDASEHEVCVWLDDNGWEEIFQDKCV